MTSPTRGADDLARHIEVVARHILGDPNREFSTETQLRFGSKGSISVEIEGPKAGAWFDFEADQGGGVFDLIYHKVGIAKGAALDWMRDELGIEIVDGDTSSKQVDPRVKSTADYAVSIATERRPVSGSPAETYLTNRHLPGPYPEALGYHPSVWHKETKRQIPALVCVARDHNGSVKFIHAVFIADGRKSTAKPSKKTFGKMVGGVVKIPGARDGNAAKIVVLTEGVEDALAINMATGMEVWACCGVANVGKAPVEEGNEIVVAADNDPPYSPATHAIDRAVHQLRKNGFKLRVIRPPEGIKDFNELLLSGGANAIVAAFEAKPQPASDWYSRCMVSSSGESLSNLANAMLALREDPATRGVFAYDRMLCTAIILRPIQRHDGTPAISGPFPRPITDVDVGALQERLQIVGFPKITKDTAHQAVDMIAMENSFHPVEKYLNSLKWDGIRRLDLWLAIYLGAVPSEYSTKIGAMFFIAMVARIFQPGCKCDYMIILEGPQGAMKSTVCAIIAGKYFSDSLPEDIGSKDTKQHLRGKWLIEMAEMHAMSKSESTALKAFITRKVEDYRPSYGRKEVHEGRQCVFVGTTNKTVYLKDGTGGRRYWPIAVAVCHGIQIELLKTDRDQLFAEAVHRFRAGEKWWPDDDFEIQHIAPEQDARFIDDAWEEPVSQYLIGRDKVTIFDVAKNGIRIESPNIGTAHQNRIRDILERLGWGLSPVRGTGGTRLWVRL